MEMSKSGVVCTLMLPHRKKFDKVNGKELRNRKRISPSQVPANRTPCTQLDGVHANPSLGVFVHDVPRAIPTEQSPRSAAFSRRADASHVSDSQSNPHERGQFIRMLNQSS